MPYGVSLGFCIAILLIIAMIMGQNPDYEARCWRNKKLVRKMRVKNKKLTSWIFFKKTVPDKYVEKVSSAKYWITWHEFIPFVAELLFFLVYFPTCVVYWISDSVFLDRLLHSFGLGVFMAVFHFIILLSWCIPHTIMILLPDD